MTILVGLLFTLAFAPPPQRPNLGLTRITVVDAAHHDTMPTLIWYPTSTPPKTTTLLLQDLGVAMDGEWSAGKKQLPLVVISHGTGGNEMGHWDLAEALVRAGYIVVSFRHAGDNHRDRSALGTDRQLLGRAAQVRAVLDSVLRDPTWAPRIDTLRIGFFGFSAGGYTGLLLAGAQPDVRRFRGYCGSAPDDPNYCANGLDGNWLMEGRYPMDEHDPRFRAIAVAAPAFSFLFDSAEIRKISVPLFIARAAFDSVVREPYNVAWLLKNLPRQPETWIAMGGHYTFLPPCGPALAATVPEICKEPAGVDRVAVHRNLNRRLVTFFDGSLLVALPVTK